jgi:hypothetical protein
MMVVNRQSSIMNVTTTCIRNMDFAFSELNRMMPVDGIFPDL